MKDENRKDYRICYFYCSVLLIQLKTKNCVAICKLANVESTVNFFNQPV